MAVTAKQSKNYVGGAWTDAASGETFESRTPANGDTVGTFPRSAAEDVDRAVEAAKAAFEEWRLTPAPERGNVLFRFARLLEDQKDELTELMSREMGKVLAEAGGDVQEAIDMSVYMAGEGRRLFGQTTPSELRDHAVELPDRDSGLEARARSRLREHRRAEAGRRHAGPRRALHRTARRVRPAGRGGEPRARLRRGGRRAARTPPGRPDHHVYRVARDGSRGH